MNITRSQFKTVGELLEFIRGVKKNYPEERQFSTIINDNKYDANTSAIVDLAVSTGCEYLNIRGFYRPEKIAKVFRYAEII